jgi:glycosidase
MDWDAEKEQRHDPDSLLIWMRQLIQLYRECPELAWGDFQVLDAGDPTVFAHRADCDGGTVIAVHNLANREITVRIPAEGQLTDLLTGGRLRQAKSGAKVDLAPYDCRWFRLVAE